MADRETPEHAPIPGIPVPGEVFAGKYRIERTLGVGGMGVVLAAHHLHLDERVAIKMLLPALAEKGEVGPRFIREGRAGMRIRGEHVARVLDVATLENGLPYIVMEYLDGADLSVVLDKRGRLPVELAIDYVLQACEALAQAHALGIVHRDLKPANLFLTTGVEGAACIKVLDFGIAKAMQKAGAPPEFSMTKTNAVVGSPLYMAPEQMRSARAVDTRVDIWSLGTILYELIAGRPPFAAATMPELCAMILQDPPESLVSRRPDAPLGVEAIVMRCLEKDPARRYATIADFAKASAEFASPEGKRSAERIDRVIQNAAKWDVTSGIASAAVTGSNPNLASRDSAPQGAVGLASARTENSSPGILAPLGHAMTGGNWGDTNSNVTKPPRDVRRFVVAGVVGGVVFAVVLIGLYWMRLARVPEPISGGQPPLVTSIATPVLPPRDPPATVNVTDLAPAASATPPPPPTSSGKPRPAAPHGHTPAAAPKPKPTPTPAPPTSSIANDRHG